MHNVRCNKCNKLLARVGGGDKVNDVALVFEIKCSRCRYINIQKAQSLLNNPQVAVNLERSHEETENKNTRQKRLQVPA